MKKTLPTKHLSARVPWHDNRWNGTFCCNVLDNSFCRILPRIDGEKDPDTENDGQVIEEGNYPPCIAEKGTFLSPNEYSRPLAHAWANINLLYKDYLPSVYHHKPFSFNAVPFLWMNKAPAKPNDQDISRGLDSPHKSLKAITYELDYRPDLEEEIDQQLGFEGNKWVQHPHNQKVLLDAFFGCLKKEESLIFFYAKDTPLSEPNERIIVGVAKVRNQVGEILNYKFADEYKGYKSYPWDRCVEHSLTSETSNGFILPYHDILKISKNSSAEIELREFVVVAPSRSEFSYASELVEHDTAIDSLLLMAESLRKSGKLLNKEFNAELEWIDREISRLWDMRGAYPSIGPLLSAINIENGNSIAWEVEKYIIEKDGNLTKTDSWQILEESFIEPEKYLGGRGKELITKTIQGKWKRRPAKKNSMIKLLSRMQLDNDQAKYLLENIKRICDNTDDIIGNLYLIYEAFRLDGQGITFKKIDKALLPAPQIAEAFPVPEPSRIEDQLDDRRARALLVSILEEASEEGHSLLTFEDALHRIQLKVLEQKFPLSEDDLEYFFSSEFFSKEVFTYKQGKLKFFKLARLEEAKEIIREFVNKERIIKNSYKIKLDWEALINKEFNTIESFRNEDYEDEVLARKEKAAALDVMVNYPFSVLIGPAGSGKTTLLKIFESLPEIRRGGVLKLAPTGKARVNLGHDGKTVAQFLYPDRYNEWAGTYEICPDKAKYSGKKNIIIDEASMLTEEQLAAIFDALGPVDRIILVGDYRQLPPIGTGRPFVDIVNLIQPGTFESEVIKAGPAYAELLRIRRQAKNKLEKRWDVQLSKCFGDEPQKQDLMVFNQLSDPAFKSEHIRLEKWYSSTDFKELFKRVLEQELGLTGADIAKHFNKTIGAFDYGEFQYFKEDFSEKAIENWQIISPVNGFGYGVKEVNKMVQSTYRQNWIDLALNLDVKKRLIPKPFGSDNIIYGDKVINLRNTKWKDGQKVYCHGKDWQQLKKDAFNYIANGEIGIMTGRFNKKNEKGGSEVRIAYATQPGYSYVYKHKSLGEESKYQFELAYAITVHKSQGSGFKKVFLILPSSGNILGRELLYTALTRQSEKIIILHQGDFRDFIRMASTDASHTARRLTDLFFVPEIREVNKKFYDARYINISERGERMISKNEVIIANILNKYNDRLDYIYEDKLKLDSSGRTVSPDFTIKNRKTGKIFYWEHLGMMTKDDYREKWLKKKESYLAEGFVVHTVARGGESKVLIITEENPNGGIDSQYFDQIVREVIIEKP